MTKVLCFYNHKGGVSKTTTAFNVAHLLAGSGKKVLIVDADPQCNMTELMLAQQINELDEKTAESGEVIPLPGKTLLELLTPRLEGTVPEVLIEDGSALVVSKNLLLIRGDVSLSKIEDSLSEAHSQRYSNNIHLKRNYVAINSFVRRYADKNGIDFVIFDVGPSSGSLTRSCFLACDEFFVPCVPDRFNVQAIGTLSSIIDTWISEHRQVYDAFKQLGLAMPTGLPIFKGVILQNYKMSGGNAKKSFQFWMDRIPAQVNVALRPVLVKHSTAEVDLTDNRGATDVVATQIPDFGGFAPIMQATGKAIFQITSADTGVTGSKWVGATWTDAEKRRNEYKAKVEQIVARL